MNWAFFVGGLLLSLAAIVAYGLLVFAADMAQDDEPDLDLIANRDEAREAVLRRLRERQRHEQAKRDASSYLTRGF